MRRHGQDEEDSAGPFIRARVLGGSRCDTPVRESLTSRDLGGIRARRVLRDLTRDLAAMALPGRGALKVDPAALVGE